MVNAIISDRFIKAICTRLTDNKQIRRSLPVWGRVHIDRQLPFLCVFRRRVQDQGALSERLIMGEAAYVISAGDRLFQKHLSNLLFGIAKTSKEIFGTFLIIELWISNDNEYSDDTASYQPVFKIYGSKISTISSTIATLEKNLSEIKIRNYQAIVKKNANHRIAPPGLPPLISLSDARKMGIHILGLEVRPIYRNERSGKDFPLIRRELQHQFGRVLKNAFYNFTHDHTPYRPLHYLSLGRWSMVKAVWEVDRQLAEICNGFDFLLHVTPVNSHAAWSGFKSQKYRKTPELIYRPLPFDPAMAKRKLYQVPIERIEDPTLAQLFRDQQLELDRKITMLCDRGTSRFLYGSLQVYGKIDNSLLKLAHQLLEQLPPRTRDESVRNSINADMFASRAASELDYFSKSYLQIPSKIFVRDDISGLMVSQGNLLISSKIKIPVQRIEALIQHEIGTHVLTYLNGKAQPFRQLYIGLPGYEELQEGLAVLSEYFVDGLTRPRLRLLAARVVAAHEMITGATFIDVFHLLNTAYYFDSNAAFSITVRTFRGGGLTKDAIYLRGLVQLLNYLKQGGDLEMLYVGKIAADHVAIIKELQWRKVLKPMPLKPRFFSDSNIKEKLNHLRKGLNPIDLIERNK